MDNATITALLNRPQFTVDLTPLAAYLHSRTVLITGAGGSIGSELVRTLSPIPCRVVLYDRSENNLVRILAETRHTVAQFVGVLGDIQNDKLLRHTFAAHRPALVLHTAAYKHLPLLETNILQAAHNNIFGTLNILSTACKFDTERFVFVSTDKAVNPTSVMGATKSAAETAVRGMPMQGTTKRMVVRLGNVLGSSGSVLPIFEKQIEAGGPVTVAHPDATRFFMSIPEAAALILHAAVTGEGGDTFVLNMGDPINIEQMAKRLIELRHSNAHISYTGMRPGEKLAEQLHSEGVTETDHPRIWKAVPRPTDMWFFRPMLASLRAAVEECREQDVMNALREMVPEYKPDSAAKLAAVNG